MSLIDYIPEYSRTEDLEKFLEAIESEDAKSVLLKGLPGGEDWNTEQLRFLAGSMPPDLLRSIIPIMGLFFKLKGTDVFLDFLYNFLGLTEPYQKVWEDEALATELGVESSNSKYRLIYIPSYAGVDKAKLEAVMYYGLPVNVSFVFGHTLGSVELVSILDVVERYSITYAVARESESTPVGRCGSQANPYSKVYSAWDDIKDAFLANPEEY